MDLEQALQQFDAVEANIEKLAGAWERLRALIPQGYFLSGAGDPEAVEYRRLCYEFSDLLTGLPQIDGWTVSSLPMDFDEIGRSRLDVEEIGEFEARVSLEDRIDDPAKEIDEYRIRFARKRRELVRRRLEELVSLVDGVISNPVAEDAALWLGWGELRELSGEIDRLLGAEASGQAWSNFRRHMSFAMGVDYHDIKERDWPLIRRQIHKFIYDASVPTPVAVSDLGSLVQSRPSGPVSAKIEWKAIDAEAFENLVYDLVVDTRGYENPQWLMQTNAPDRARDISVTRVYDDALIGVLRQRMIIQCKHWLSRSVADTDISNALTKMAHWEPPAVDIMVVATTGRFTADAVRWAEQHNHQGKRPLIELWPENAIERMLARRAPLVVKYRLREGRPVPR